MLSFHSTMVRRNPLSAAVILFAVFSLLLCPEAKSVDPGKRISQYGHSAWRVQDGDLGSGPLAITQTTDGYLWIGTASGLLRFDGVRLLPWVPPGGEVLKTTLISVLLTTHDGSLWIGTDGQGVWRWQNSKIERFLPSGAATIASILEDHQGTIWVARRNVEDGSGRICQVSSGSSRCFNSLDGLGLQCCEASAEDHEGNLWFGGSSDFAIWNPHTSFLRTYHIPGENHESGSVTSIIPEDSGTAWIGSMDRGLQSFRDGHLESVKIGNWYSSSEGSYSALLDKHGRLWVGTTSNGLYRVSDGRLEHFGVLDGLTGNTIYKLFEDREGNLWALTPRGIDCFRDLHIASFSAKEGLHSSEFDSVLATRDGALWVGENGNIDIFKDGTFATIRPGMDLTDRQVTSLLEDHLGRVWVGMDRKFGKLEDGTFREVLRPNGQPVGFVVEAAEDSRNDIWVEVSQNPRELIQIHDSKVTQIIRSPQIPPARKIAADLHDGIWLGLLNGDLARYRDGKLDTFHYPHKNDSWVNQINVDKDGTVWGSTAFGLIGWHNGEQRILSQRNGLPCDSVNASMEDNSDAMWLNTQCGYIELKRKDVESWWRNPDRAIKFRLYDPVDGAQPGWSPFQGAARTRDGKLWFANQIVLQMIDPQHLNINSLAPSINVEGIYADNREIAMSTAKLSLPALTRDVRIRYTAPSFTAPQKVSFRYKLDGQDKTWQEAGARREAFYTNLGPGDYRFRVTACNNDGVCNSSGELLSFAIEPAYYQTKLFLFACLAVVAGTIWLLSFLRLKQARAQIEQRLGAQTEERERISRELHDTLLQGFQGLMLRFQAVMKMLPPEEPARQIMEKVMDRADEVLVEGRQRVQGLRGRAIANGDLAEALRQFGEELSESSQANFSITVLGESIPLEPIVFEESFRIAREALINAFQHSRAATIEVEIIYDANRFTVRVRDDGIGMAPSILNSGKVGHWGLSGMHERARAIGAKLKVWSQLKAGTEVELQSPEPVPLARQSARFWNKATRRLK